MKHGKHLTEVDLHCYKTDARTRVMLITEKGSFIPPG